MEVVAPQPNETAAARKREWLTKLREYMARIPDDKKEMAKIVLLRKLREIGDARLRKSEMLKKFREIMERLPDDKKEMVKILLEGMLRGIQGGDANGIQNLRDFFRSKACLPDGQNSPSAPSPPPSVSRPRKRKACLISS
ncbi:unnamed protein product [Caenorhabditis brenneri]